MDDLDVNRLIHDLRNPLNSIAMTAELAKLQVQQNASSESVAESLDTIVRICRDCGRRLEEYGRVQDAPHPGAGASQDARRREDDGTPRVD